MGGKILLAVVFFAGLFQQRQQGVSAEVFRDCGGFLEEPRGVVQSPFFPNRFPLPLSCRWIIHAPPEKKIVLYFTQYFLREAFMVTEYEYYVSEQEYTGRTSLGLINFEDHIRTVVAYKPFLVLDFSLHHMTNIHLRVEEYLEDVYGFNITYEIVGRSERVRQDTCSVNDCSFLGHCKASADFSTYQCQCFPEFFGKECQYGPFCDPDKGINMCLNQGRCRYFSGSMVNMCDCPPGYIGPQCEQGVDIVDEEHKSEMSSSEEKNPECTKLGCSDHCLKNYDGLLQCACEDGYKLDTDNITCVEQELFRVSVTVPLLHRPDDWNKEQAESDAITILQRTGIRSSKRFQFDGVDSSSGQKVQKLHFYVDQSDLDLVEEGVKNLMARDKMFELSVLSANSTVQVDPEMKLLSVVSYHDDPALESQMLILVCSARGSQNLKFRWYKDQFLFNASLTSRSAWEVRVEQEVEDDKQMFIFNVEGVTMFDKGLFSCEIEDFGEVEQRSLMVDVMPLPQVEIKPLTANLLAGGSLSFRCLSPDENMRTFSYQWLRDGEVLDQKDRVNGEIVEDLLPSGSRLFIPQLKVSANYTCRVVNRAGAAQKSAYVFLIPANMSGVVCDSASYEGVNWNRTYGGHYDLQKCPIDTADFKVVGLGEGYVRRDCLCEGTVCSWGPPNYARCHSIHLIHLKEQLERCQLGYQQDGLSSVYNSLYEILRKAQNRTLAGDVDMFATNLYTLFDVSLKFPAVAPDPAKSSFNLTTVGNFMNMLLHEVKTTNEFEKRDLSVGARFVRVCEILAELTRENPSLIPLFNLTLPRISFVVKNVTVVALNKSEENTELSDGEVLQSSMAYTGRQLLSVGTEGAAQPRSLGQLEVLQVTYSPDIMAILRVSAPRPEFKKIQAPLVSVMPVGENEILLDDSYRVKDGKVEVEFAHPFQFAAFIENITQCVAWDRRDSWQLVGEWKTGLCDVTYRTANVTRCLCPVPGHYTVVVTATNTTIPPELPVQKHTVLQVACIFSLCGMLVALLVYVLCWKRMAGDSSMIHANFILSLAGINLACILCLIYTDRQTLCILGKVVMHFLQLAAISFLLMEAIHTYVCIQSTGFGGMTRIKYTCVKYFLIGWGIPSLATMAVALLSEVFGFDDTCSTWCWWSAGHWQHYSFLVPLVVMVLVQVIIMSASLLCMRLWKGEYRFRDRKKYIYIAVRAYILQTLVVLLSVSGHVVEENSSLSRQWFFATVDILLTIAVLITLLLLKPHVRRSVFSFLIPEHKRALASGSFRAFVLPDRVEDSEELEVKRIQQYCIELDRSKFTSQHKQTLRNLLGSSSSGSDASASGTGSSPRSLPVAGPDFFTRRTHSAGSRSSSSEYGPRACAGAEGGIPLATVLPAGKRGGGRKNRPRKPGVKAQQQQPQQQPQPQQQQQQQSLQTTPKGRASPSRQTLCREGLSPEHDWAHQQCLRVLDPVVVTVTEGQPSPPVHGGQLHHHQRLPHHHNPPPRDPGSLPDSGYDGTESDNPSLQQGLLPYDLDSQVSSDLDTEPSGDGEGESPPPSSSVLSPSSSTTAAAGSSDTPRLAPSRLAPSPARGTHFSRGRNSAASDSVRGHDVTEEEEEEEEESNCDVIGSDARLSRDVTAPQTKDGEEPTEREALLSSATDTEEPSQDDINKSNDNGERQAFVTSS